MNTENEAASFITQTNRRRALKKIGLGMLATAAMEFTSSQAQEIRSNGTSQTGQTGQTGRTGQTGQTGQGGGGTDTGSTSPGLDIFTLSVLDFALNLEYLEANFYSYASTGADIESQGVAITGVGTQGSVIVPDSTMVDFSNPNIAAYAAEITADEIAHVNFLRSVYALYHLQPPAQPEIDLLNSFNTAASAAGLGSSFSPFTDSAGDLNFLLGAFIFEDVGVTAYHGAISSLTNDTILTSAAGIMGTEAYHAANIRDEIYKLGNGAISAADAISNARNTLGGEGLDQGLQFAGLSNIVPADANALVFARTMRLVLNIVYLGVNATKGGFFPNGINTHTTTGFRL